MGSNPDSDEDVTPGPSEENVPGPFQPRQPRNLQGLLRFAMEATKAEDAPGNSEFLPMDEERRQFLEEALKSLTVDMAQVIRSAIQVLTDADKIRSIQLGEYLPEDVQNSFNNLLECLDDMDIANDFYKVGGFAIFPICYSSDHDDVRARTSAVLAEICQNNPFCQARTLECGLLNVLLNLVQSEKGPPLTKCLYAISCSIRGYEPGCREFIAQGGCKVLMPLLSTVEHAARTKAAFIVRYLCRNYPDAKEQFLELNIVRILAEQMKKGRDDATEHHLNILLALTEDRNPAVIELCRHPTLDLKNMIENLLDDPEVIRDRFSEEIIFGEELLTTVFENCPTVEVLDDELADR